MRIICPRRATGTICRLGEVDTWSNYYDRRNLGAVGLKRDLAADLVFFGPVETRLADPRNRN